MSTIKVGSGYWRKNIRVDHKDFYFNYYAPTNKNDLKRKGKRLTIGVQGGKNALINFSIHLNGTQINTLKRILEVAGEIEQYHNING